MSEPNEGDESFSPHGFSLSQASGVIIREDGYIVTNRHVIEDGEKIEVRLQDGRRFQAEVRGKDAESDLAVLKIEAQGLRPARLANSDRTRVGEFAVAIGVPYHLDYSVTFGHVSAKGRANIVPNFLGNPMMDQDFIQTDANINPGNSGGPLVNLDGEVIGINTLIRGLHTGIGFAIPSNIAREISDQIVATGRFARPWLGVSIHDVREDPHYEQLLKAAGDGVVIARILPKGPTANSELRENDIITKVDGRRTRTARELRNEIRTKKIGRSIPLEIVRAGRRQTIHVAPGEYVPPEPVFAATPPPSSVRPADLGLMVHSLTEELAERYGATKTNGVLVIAVDEEGPADHSGIKPGDVISAVNDQTTATPYEFRAALDAADWNQGVRVHLNRHGTNHVETITLAKEALAPKTPH